MRSAPEVSIGAGRSARQMRPHRIVPNWYSVAQLPRRLSFPQDHPARRLDRMAANQWAL